MRFQTVAILAGAAAATANKTESLFLPGFSGYDLSASVIGSEGDSTTYLVSCPQATAGSCNIKGKKGLTATAAPTSAQVVDVDKNGNTASVSCNIAGTTYASCSASYGSQTVQHTLAQSQINWMPVTITSCTTSTPTPSSTWTPTSTPHSVRSTSTPKPTSTPMASSKKPTVPQSTPLVPTEAPAGSEPTQAPAGNPAPTQSAAASSSTPASYNGAASMAGNSWAMAGAAMLAYALA